jgi:hypothetical protein
MTVGPEPHSPESSVEVSAPTPQAPISAPYWRPPGPTGGLGAATTICLAGLIGIQGLQIGTSVATLLRAGSRRREVASEQLFFADGWEIGIYTGITCLLILAGIIWMIWQNRAHTNLGALQPVRFRPNAIWWWIVPVASLFMPFRAIRELAQANADRPTLRRWWWGSFIAWNAGSGLFFRLPEFFGAGLTVSESLSIVAGLIGVVAAVLAILVVRTVDTGLDARRSAAGWPVARRPLPLGPLLLWGTGATLMAASGAFTLGLALPAIERIGLASQPVTSNYEVGTCFDETEGFPEAKCDEAHDAEVFVRIDHPDQVAYPGEGAIKEWAEPLCYGQFEPYTGVPYEESLLDFGYLYPTQQGWAAGDREVLCYLFDPSGVLSAPIRNDRTA